MNIDTYLLRVLICRWSCFGCYSLCQPQWPLAKTQPAETSCTETAINRSPLSLLKPTSSRKRHVRKCAETLGFIAAITCTNRTGTRLGNAFLIEMSSDLPLFVLQDCTLFGVQLSDYLASCLTLGLPIPRPDCIADPCVSFLDSHCVFQSNLVDLSTNVEDVKSCSVRINRTTETSAQPLKTPTGKVFRQSKMQVYRVLCIHQHLHAVRWHGPEL